MEAVKAPSPLPKPRYTMISPSGPTAGKFGMIRMTDANSVLNGKAEKVAALKRRETTRENKIEL